MRLAVSTLVLAGMTFMPALGAQKGEPKPFRGKSSHVHFDSKKLTWRIGNDAVERTIHFDRDMGSLQTIAVKSPGGKALVTSPSEGEFQVTDSAGQKRTVALDRDWAYQWQSSGVSTHEGKKLTIHLWGVRSNHGYEAEANYEVYPGNRPYLEKSLTLINRTGGPVTVTGATLDRWALGADGKAKKGKGAAAQIAVGGAFSGGKENGMLVDSASQRGAVALAPGGSVADENGAIVQRYQGSVVADAKGGRAYLPKTVFFTFQGNTGAGSDLIGRYHTMNSTVASK